MAIFATLRTEKKVQVGDRTRLDASASFTSDRAEISKIEIKPSASDAFIDVTGVNYLDWAYGAAAEVTAQVKVTIESRRQETSISGGIPGYGGMTFGYEDQQGVSHEEEIPFDATSSMAQTAIRKIPGFEGVTVTGDVESGFVISALPAGRQLYVSSQLEISMASGPIDVSITDVEIVPDSGTGSAELEVVTAEADALFSNDQDLTALEPSILGLLTDGRSSFLNVHRAAQEIILDVVNRTVGSKTWIDSSKIADKREVKEWSKHLTLQLIFEGSINAADDVFAVKSRKYREMASAAAQRALSIDLDGSGTVDENERVSMTSIPVVRR